MDKLLHTAIGLVFLFGLAAPSASAEPELALNTWTPTRSGLAEGGPTNYPEVFVLAISPQFASDDTIYAGTDFGTFKSTDRGATWVNMTPTRNEAGPVDSISLSFSPADASCQTMVAATGSELILTTDGWETWSGLGWGGASNNTAVFSPDYAHDGLIFVGGFGGGVYADGVQIDSANPIKDTITSILFDPDYAYNQTLYVSSSGSGVFKGVKQEGDWTWTPLNTGLDTGEDPSNQLFVTAMAISPNFAADHTFYIGTPVGIYRSTNGGEAWSLVSDRNLGILTFAISPEYAQDRTVYAGEDGLGVLRSTDGGASWRLMNQGFADEAAGGSILTLTFAPGEPTHLFAGFWADPDGGVWQLRLPAAQVFLPMVKNPELP